MKHGWPHKFWDTFGEPPASKSICFLSSSAPQPQSAQQTAQQQTQSNVQTGIANAVLGNTNQVTPEGTLTYTQSGGQQVGDNFVPQYTATQTLSPDQQQIYNSQTALTNQALGSIAPNVLNQIQGTTGQPLNFNNAAPLPGDQTAAENAAYGQLMARQNQNNQIQTQQEQTQLANQGIAPGSEAYSNALRPIQQAQTDAVNQASLQASTLAGQNINQAQQLRNQTINEDTQLYNQPLQTYGALTGVSGGATSPTYATPTQASVQPTDIAGINANTYAGQLQAYQSGQATTNAVLGGLFGLGGSAGAAGILKYSDRRLKSEIERVGTSDNGLSLYRYTIFGRPEVGVMADEVAKVRPGAVHMGSDGFLMVDYAEALRG